MSRLLGRVRKVVTFFHRSTTAAAVLKEKQVMLQLPLHKLVQDVATRWNSSHDMLERYLEQQAAVFSALTDKSVKKSIKDIVTLSDDDVKLAEDVVQVLKPLKTVTTLMSTEQIPTISMILPLKHRILASMKHSGPDSTVVKDIKAAIAHDFEDRYPDTDRALIQFLHMSTALDPRFKSLPFLDETTHDTIFKSLTERILDNCSQTVQNVTFLSESDGIRGTTVLQQPVFDRLHPGDSVTLQCSVISQICAGQYSVYWFRHSSGYSHPGIIYTDDNRSDQCMERSENGSSTQSCVYSLSQTELRPSDTGIYYCAVATCGKIHLGNGTKLIIEDSSASTFRNPVFLTLLTFTIISIIVNAFLVMVIRKNYKTGKESSKQPRNQSNEVNFSTNHRFFHKQCISRGCDNDWGSNQRQTLLAASLPVEE
ncbi:zinc finger BED domain-containing 1-like protein [Labeo rohita]|uniref:Zinc finger BED domain-containing 1-like protein n=1 Tax=Labeo rohita TaxID=84645 RepID=A0A498M8I1_LABRO|nr:zinc finger BED domain-containing 1-like protein [Labeo rohita]